MTSFITKPLKERTLETSYKKYHQPNERSSTMGLTTPLQ